MMAGVVSSLDKDSATLSVCKACKHKIINE